MRSGAVGILAVRADGDTLACINHRMRLVPASNMKLITTGLALRQLGPGFRFETTLAYVGELTDGVLEGDVFIVGGGDPTTGAKDLFAPSAGELFGHWMALLQKAGIRSVKGRIIGDGRFFRDATREGLGESYEDVGTSYGAGPAGLNFFENAQNFYVSPGPAVGQRPYVSPRYPETPWMQFSVNATTSAAGSSNDLYYVCTEFGPYGEVRGSFPIDRRGYTLECANKFGPLTCAFYFYKYLNANGLPVSGYGDVSPRGFIRTDVGFARSGAPAPKPGEMTVAGSTRSAALSEIVAATNARSDNFYAETLFRMLGRSRFGSDLQDSCRVAADEALRSIGLQTRARADVFDGSGLSRKNYVSADFFVSFLRNMARSRVWAEFYESLPVPGQEKSSLASRFRNAPEEFKARIHMKSGSMNGVRCFSGYIDSSDGDPAHMVAFSVLTNNITGSSYTVYPVIEDIIAAIAAEN